MPLRPTAAALFTAAVLALGTAAPGAAAASDTVSTLPSAAAAVAAAASGSFQQVTGFGTNPGNLAMYTYTPAGLPSGAPLVVALHGCVQSATDYYRSSGWTKFADQYGFAVVFPQTSSVNNSLSCFSWFDAGKAARGVGEARSVVEMVTKAESLYGSDARRVFVTGLSAGGGMAADLLADYPDVFAGGAIDSGLPAHCAATQAAASGCQNSDQGLTPAQWGDKVRAAYPGYTGPWPRVAIWQGTADTVVRPVNATELRDQWTNVQGGGRQPTGTRSLPGGTTQELYADASGKPAVAVFTISGMGHGLAVHPGSGADQCGATGAYFLDTICSGYYTAQFWGLDGGSGPTDPGLPAPTGLTASATAGSIALGWQAVSGASSYQVFRNGGQVGTTTGTTFTDTGLAAGTTYGYTVAAVDGSGTVGARSAAVTATTPGGGAPQCFTASNYDQVLAGRATQSGGLTFALGSGQSMGLWNTFVTHTLKQTGPGFYVLADGQC
ncbi:MULTISPECIES: extracellular catalytic domain type 1 short-chain-length polyhydroxyalkanoate depolymerase [Streptomycetaceae]|uniref:extracellular catalytic domain type 1 short-chain-length polyhydroxyalkanoate depolymerase n=1 Tax=Streptomycetaceae TaxID=2062 RepID=UPI00093E0241|nr:PHB depolymerase family esterase [Streptomyces sp. CB02056]OKI05751.1 esterase [Streptomyces sp. CB02056]